MLTVTHSEDPKVNPHQALVPIVGYSWLFGMCAAVVIYGGGLATAEGSPTSNLPLRAGKRYLYEGGIRVSLIVRWPGVVKAGTTSDVPHPGCEKLVDPYGPDGLPRKQKR